MIVISEEYGVDTACEFNPVASLWAEVFGTSMNAWMNDDQKNFTPCWSSVPKTWALPCFVKTARPFLKTSMSMP